MATFVSVTKGLKVWGEKIVKGKNVGEKLADFAPVGSFTTEDEELIAKLRAHGACGKGKRYGFIEAGTMSKPKSNVIQGVRSAGNSPILGKDEKLIRLGVLRASLLKKDGAPRRDASEKELEELKEIQDELGV